MAFVVVLAVVIIFTVLLLTSCIDQPRPCQWIQDVYISRRTWPALRSYKVWRQEIFVLYGTGKEPHQCLCMMCCRSREGERDPGAAPTPRKSNGTSSDAYMSIDYLSQQSSHMKKQSGSLALASLVNDTDNQCQAGVACVLIGSELAFTFVFVAFSYSPSRAFLP